MKKPLLALIAVIVIAGCSVPRLPFPSSQTQAPSAPPVVTTHPVQTQEQAIQNPEEVARTAAEYLEQARRASPPERERLTLEAAELLLETGDAEAALAIVRDMDASSLPVSLQWRLKLVRAEIALRQSRPADAMRDLAAPGELPERALNAKRLGLMAQAGLARGDRLVALQALVDRERWLDGDDRVLQNQQQVWRIVESLSVPELRRARALVRDPVVVGWLDLALISDEFGSDPYRYDQELRNWRITHPAHPASQTFLATLAPAILSPRRTEQVRQIALLLPLASRFGHAAQAVHDGFMAMHGSDPRPDKPNVLVYDIGEEPSLAPIYYRLAVNDGADFVVGPLGKDAVSAVAADETPGIPILLLGTVAGAIPRGADIYQFDLSPEQEAQQAAERAYLDGHRIALVFFTATEWGQRVRDAFRIRWEELGGLIVGDQSFNTHGGGLSAAVQRALDVDRSEARKNLLANRLGVALQFQPRRRQDIDCIFVAAQAGEARLLKPQINYFRAHDLPVYATSHVYAAQHDPVNDADLNGVVFGDMPWLLLDDRTLRAKRAMLPNQGSPYRNTPLDRLYALGMDAYEIIPSLAYLRSNPVSQVSGVTARLNVTPNGHINRRLTWARFENGLPVVQDTILDNRSGGLNGAGSVGAEPKTRQVGGT